MLEIAGVILCGGKSSRMGENKALLPFHTSNLLQFVYEKYKTIFSKVYLCCKREHRDFYAPFGQDLLFEESEIFSPMIGIESALSKLNCPLFFTSVDCPFLQEEHFVLIKNEFSRSQVEITYARTSLKSHYLIGLYDPKVLPNLQKRIQERNFKMQSFVLSSLHSSVFFSKEEDFSNLNTPSDYQNALMRGHNGK